MIISGFLDFIFSILGVILGFLPVDTCDLTIDGIFTIFGYGIYFLGGQFFSLIVTLITAELVGWTAFDLAVWVFNKIRGAG